MSAFTIELREVIRFTGGSTELGANGITVLTGGDIGIQYYPIFDETYRATLTGKIIDHYWNREIGFETIDIFKMKMRSRMNEIMQYYNQLYTSERLIIDPLNTVDLRTLSTGESSQNVTASGDTVTNSATKSESRVVQSSTPQVMLSGNKDYADAAADTNTKGDSDSTANETTKSDSDTTQSNDSHVTGFQGSQAELLNVFRSTFLNIDSMVISDLDELFMQVWDTNDTYTITERWYYL